MTVVQEPFYLPVDGGECFCIYRRFTATSPAGTILHLPAFGDEMNKSRAMTAAAARAFAARGWGVLSIDLIGCGDSSGTHGDATLARWIDNARRALDWLGNQREATGFPWLWCLRAGALLVPALVKGAPRASILLWQPIISGRQQLHQLLRQKLAGGLLESGADAAGAKAPREQLQRQTLEIGGYAISPTLASELEDVTFDVPASHRGWVHWFEISATSAPVLSAAARAQVASLRSTGVSVSAMALQGPGFWQSAEIEYCASLIDASVAAIGN